MHSPCNKQSRLPSYPKKEDMTMAITMTNVYLAINLLPFWSTFKKILAGTCNNEKYDIKCS